MVAWSEAAGEVSAARVLTCSTSFVAIPSAGVGGFVSKSYRQNGRPLVGGALRAATIAVSRSFVAFWISS